jgi:hypothetical protein
MSAPEHIRTVERSVEQRGAGRKPARESRAALQVFAERVTVVLDSDLGTCSVFTPREIEPVSWEV